MSEFDAYETAFAGDLAARLGDAAGVEHEIRSRQTRTKYDAIVEPLRTERMETIVGNNERTEDRDLVRVSVRCPPGTLGISDPLAVFKYMTTAANYQSERFVIRSIESVDGAWTVCEVWRKSLAELKQRSS